MPVTTLILDSLLRGAGISPARADQQLAQRAQWQMSAYLDVACKRVLQGGPPDAALAARDAHVEALLARLHAVDGAQSGV